MRCLWWLIAAFIVLGFLYMWATPIFEASDELKHFGVVEYIRENRDLPVQVPSEGETPWRQEGSQPPLYYAIAAVLTLPISLDDIDALREINPHAQIGVPGAATNKNMILHDDLHPPLRLTALAVYVVRTFSLFLGVITIVAVYYTARLLVPSETNRSPVPLLAAGLTAFNPMFLFITASVNNDNLVTALNGVVIYLLVLTLRRGFDTRRSLLMAVLLSLATLTKLSGLVLVPVVGLAALWIAYQQQDMRGLFVLGAAMAVSWLVLAGWWYARNLNLYGELFGTSTMVAIAGPRPEPFTVSTLLDEFEGFRITYWGLFGAVNVLTFRAFYTVMDIVTVMAVVGLSIYIYQLWQKRGDNQDHLLPTIAFLALVVLLGAAGVIQWTAQTYASQGRLLFPFVAATSPLLALGLVKVLPEGAVTRWTAVIGIAALGIFALIVPFVSIVPAYRPPEPVASLPEEARPVYARYDDIELLGYKTPDARYMPGDGVPVTVFWRPVAQSERDLSLYLHAIDHRGDVIGKVDSYPGGGTLQTSTWTPGAIYPDDYMLPLSEDASENFQLRVQVGWWHFPTEQNIAPLGEDGSTLESVLLAAGGIVDPNWSPDVEMFEQIEPVEFGDAIILTGYRLSGNDLTLLWEATDAPQDDYTVFAQVVGAENTVVAQGDAPPTLPTRYWRDGEQFVTEHRLAYTTQPPTGTYSLIVGWYRPSDFVRLATEHPDNAYELTTIEY